MIFRLIAHEKLREVFTICRVIHMKTLMVKPEKILWKHTIFRVNEPKLVCPFSHEKSGKNTRFFIRFHMNSSEKNFLHSATKNLVFRNEFRLSKRQSTPIDSENRNYAAIGFALSFH